MEVINHSTGQCCYCSSVNSFKMNIVYIVYQKCRSLCSVVGIAETLGLNNQISKFCQGQEICLFSKMSRLAVDPTWPVQWVTATLSCGVKQLWHYADQLHPPSADVKNDWNCISACPICLHGMYRENFTSASYIKIYFNITLL